MKNATKKTTIVTGQEKIIFSKHFIAVGTDAQEDQGWDIWSLEELSEPMFREVQPRFRVGLQLHLPKLMELLDAIVDARESRANKNT